MVNGGWVPTYIHTVADPGVSQGRGQPAKEGPRQGAPQAVMGPSRFEGQRGPFETSDVQRAHYELRRLPSDCSESLFRRSEDPLLMSSEDPSGGQ